MGVGGSRNVRALGQGGVTSLRRGEGKFKTQEREPLPQSSSSPRTLTSLAAASPAVLHAICSYRPHLELPL